MGQETTTYTASRSVRPILVLTEQYGMQKSVIQVVATAAALYLSKLSHPGQVLLFHDHDVMLVYAKSGPLAQSVT